MISKNDAEERMYQILIGGTMFLLIMVALIGMDGEKILENRLYRLLVAATLIKGLYASVSLVRSRRAA